MIGLLKLLAFRFKRGYGRAICERRGHVPETIAEDAGPSGLWVITRCPRCYTVVDVQLGKRRRVA